MSGPASPFDEIFNNPDPDNLLKVGRSASVASTEHQIALGHFEAICAFIDEHGFEPGSIDGGRDPGLDECSAQTHLETFRAGPIYRKILAPVDRHGLLGAEPTKPAQIRTMDEITSSEDPLLHDDSDHIFIEQNVTFAVRREAPEDIARRRECEDFERFADIFRDVAIDVESEKRKLTKFTGMATIIPGAIFHFGGLLAYIAETGNLSMRRTKMDARTRIIFSNGTESNLLVTSIARAFYDNADSRHVVLAKPGISGPLFGDHVLEPEDRVTGTIYVVESLSTIPEIAELRGRLYKIGFTRRPVNERFRNVEADATFLLAPVRLVAAYQAVNMNPSTLESLIHQFFEPAQLQVDILLGRKVQPQEWFVLNLGVIEEAISHIVDHTILQYRYDSINQSIVRKS